MTGPVTSSMALRAASRGGHALVQPALDVLDDHDGVVHDDADRQHQAEQRQVVQREAEGGHHGEGADDGHRHGDQRDDRRPPTLQKDQHHQRHQDHRVAQACRRPR